MAQSSTGVWTTTLSHKLSTPVNFRHAIDEKNRLTIPSRWRRGESEDFILLADANQQFLLVMSHAEFDRMSSSAAVRAERFGARSPHFFAPAARARRARRIGQTRPARFARTIFASNWG